MALRYIHGTEPQSQSFDYLQMTDGELSLQLLKRQLELRLQGDPLSSYAKSWKWAIKKLEDAIYKGLHNFTPNWFTSFGLNDEERKIIAAISKASKRFGSASSFQILSDRATALHGTDPIGQLQMLNCSEVQRYRIVRFEGGLPIQEETAEWTKCQNQLTSPNSELSKQNRFRSALNEHFEKSSALPLYEFISQEELVRLNSIDPILVSKVVNHKRSITDTAQLTAVSRDNIRAWQRNGVIAQSLSRGIGAKDPEQIISDLKANPDMGRYDERGVKIAGIEGIGDPITLIAIAVIIAISAISFAGIVQTFRGEEPTAFRYMGEVLSEGTKAVGADWKSGNPNNGGNNGGGAGGNNSGGAGGNNGGGTGGNNGGGTGGNNGGGNGGDDEDDPKDNKGLIIAGAAALLGGLLLLNKENN